MKTLMMIVVAAAALTACDKSTSSSAPPSATTASSSSAKVDKAVAIAKAIEATPDQADQILSKNGMSEQQFNDLMYEIASDPQMSDQYAARMGK